MRKKPELAIRAIQDSNRKEPVSSKLYRLFSQHRTLSILLIIAVYIAIFSIKYTDIFPTFYNFSAVLLALSIETIVVVAMTILLISGEIDLSVGWNMALAGIICTHLIVYEKQSILAAIVITLVISTLMGLLNGWLVAVIGVNSFITTLASGLVYYGLALKISGGSTITHLPDTFNVLGQKEFLKLQMPVWYAFIIVLVFAYLMTRTSTFKKYYYIGTNAKAAVLSGINVKKLKVMAFVISSLLASFAGIISAARFGNAMALVGQGMELKAITASVVGGVSFTGGVGTIFGAVVGEIFMALLNNGMIIAEVNAYWQQIIVGLVLLAAVVLDVMLVKKGRKV
jgi:ribose/xylose/arabinose/galactoside ABC-type transport system permease subunit